MFRLFLFIIFFFTYSVGIHALSGDVIPEEPSLCSQLYSIEGPEQVKLDSTHEYQIVSTGTGNLEFSGSVVYTLRRDKKVVETIRERSKYLRYFTIAGKPTLEAKIEPAEGNCEGILRKDIRVYESVFTYIGNDKISSDTGVVDIFERNDILYKTFSDQVKLSQSEKATEVWESIKESDTLVVGSADILGFFSDIARLQKMNQLNFSNKRIYIVSDFSRSFLSKVIASPLSQIAASKVFLISSDQFYGLITRISSDEREVNIGQELSYEKSKKVYSLSGFLEFLAYSGFSYQLLAFLLSITFVVLVLNILKQIVGFNVFGIYYPILFAITVSLLGVSAIIFILIGFFSILCVNFFSHKIHLLLHAKRALLISLYIALFLFILGIDNYFEWSFIDYEIFDNSLIIFPLFIAIILADKIFQEDIHIFGKSGILDIAQYGIITFAIYWLLEYTTLQYFLISYPDIIILVVFLNILVGRYTGLQLFEYFRFSPLLRKLNEEE
ncbi:hypothetical protein KBD33_01200 [Candidatus Gracilibacteria bacterium]|nr:hypothetical protein [Candidatus Gracilibacteria bacterium]